MNEFMVPAADASDIDLYVRNKHPADLVCASEENIVLFVHGATYPAETSFDLPLNGLSWMDYIAQRGYDVYLMDVRGYGRSTRPAQMRQPPDQHPPIVDTSTAVRDVATAIDFIAKRRGVGRLKLIGWSWGATVMACYTTRHNEHVAKLVLYAPQWLRKVDSLTDTGGKLGAYRTVTRDHARARWLTGVPEHKRSELIPPGWFEAWADATWATDAVGAAPDPPVLRAPNGAVADTRAYWGAGKALYDPGEIRVPTLLVHAEWDADWPNDSFYAYFDRLVNAPYKRLVQIGEGTHTVLMEKNRMQLFEAVQHFLEEELEVGR